jgi:thiol peroxidase
MGIGTDIRFKGHAMQLAGRQVSLGEPAPDFQGLVGWSKITLADTPAVPRLFATVPSLDTPVCQRQTKSINQEIIPLGNKVACYTFSLDLPFAQQRYCSAEGVANVVAVSDAYNRSFGANYGALLVGLPVPLLTRALFVLDSGGILRHVDYVNEVTEEPDYKKAVSVLRELLG